jgi:hypothetical protein
MCTLMWSEQIEHNWLMKHLNLFSSRICPSLGKAWAKPGQNVATSNVNVVVRNVVHL